MRRELAGFWYDRRAGRSEGAARAERAARALGAGARTLVLGRLALAYTGPALEHQPAPDRPLCLLDGTIYAIDGRPPAEPAELELSRLFAERGRALLPSLRGDFAVVLAGPDGGDPLLARDQMGGRALLYHRGSDGALAFATEHGPLLRMLDRRPGPDLATLSHWVAVSGLPPERSLYEGVERLPPGTALAPASLSEPLRWWAPRYEGTLRGDRAELAELLRGRIETAVARRSAAPEHTAILLSGGLDSGSVAAVARARRAYSATFPDHPEVDESRLIELLSAELGLAGTQLEVRSGSVLAGALEYVERWALPPVSPNLFFWLPLLRRAAAEGVEVMLDGEGGDELFGLAPHLLADRLRRGRLASAIGLVHRIPGAEGRPPLRSSWRIMRRYGLKGAVPYRAHAAIRALRGPHEYAPPWLRPELAPLLARTDLSYAWKRTRGPRWFAHLSAQVTRGAGATMAYDHVRRRAALAGLEARHPLVDVDVIETVLRLPPELAYDARHSRPLLREAMAGLLPDEVRMRPAKSSFDAVFHQSLGGRDLPQARRLLLDPRARVGEVARREAVQEMLERPPRGGRELQVWAMTVWRLLTAECWLREQEEPGWAGHAREELSAEHDARRVAVAR